MNRWLSDLARLAGVVTTGALALCLAGALEVGALDTCIGDCNADGEVTVDELVTGVSIALGETALGACPAFDGNQDSEVTVDEVVNAVGSALVGCPKPGTLLRGIQFIPDSYETGSDLRTRLLLAGSELVFTDGSDFPIKVLSLETGRVRSLVRKMGVPEDLAVAGGSVVWTEAQSGIGDSGCVGAGVIRVVNQTILGPTGSTRRLARRDNCGGAVGDVVGREDAVYWLSSRVSPPEYSIERTPRDGGSSETLYTTSEDIVSLTADGSDLYWREGFLDPGFTGTLRRMPLSGGPPSVVAEGLGSGGSSAGGLALHAGFAILTETTFPTSYRLTAVPLDGGVPRVLAEIPAPARSIVGLGTEVYWIDDEALRSVPLAGGTVTTWLDDVESGIDLTVEDDTLVWTESVCCAHGQEGRVRRLEPGGEPVNLAEDVDDPGAVAASDGMVYWAEGGSIGLTEGFGRIAVVPIEGGSVSDVAAGVSTTLPIVAADGANLYYADRWRVKKVPLEGGTPVTVGAADFYISALSTDGDRVYWNEDPFATVRSAPAAGGDATTLASGSGPAGPLVAFGDFVYWADSFVRILRAPKAGGSTEVVATGIAFLSDLVVDSSGVYFSEQDSGLIRRAPLQGGPAATVGSGAPFSWNILALDEDTVYWIEQTNAASAPKTGGPQNILVTGLDSDVSVANAIATDGSFLYWTEVAGGTIRAMPLD